MKYQRLNRPIVVEREWRQAPDRYGHVVLRLEPAERFEPTVAWEVPPGLIPDRYRETILGAIAERFEPPAEPDEPALAHVHVRVTGGSHDPARPHPEAYRYAALGAFAKALYSVDEAGRPDWSECRPPTAGSAVAPPPINIRGLDHLVLRVIDLDAMLHFYCTVLGCRIERRQDELGLVQLRAGHGLIDLVPVSGPLGRAGGAAPGREGRNLDHFCLRVEPFDEAAIRAELARHGCSAGPLEARYGAEGMGPSIYLADPEGNVVELKGPPAR